MHCLVTGGAGFIGSHLVDRLLALGHKVTVWDDYSTGSGKNENSAARYLFIDISKIDPKFYYEKTYDVIYHLAARPRIQPSFKEPVAVHNANVTGTVHMLEIARLQQCRLIFADSSSVYYNTKHSSPYTFSKSLAGQYCAMYNEIYKVPVTLARLFNVYGPRQLEDGPYATVIGIFQKQRREERPLTIMGDGEQSRDFVHVDDVVDALCAMGQVDCNAEVFHVGSGESHSINKVADMFGQKKVYIPKRVNEPYLTLALISLTRERFGFNPKRKLEDYINSA